MERITVEITQRYIGQEGHMKPGDTAVVVIKRARELIDAGKARIKVGPTETKAETPPENNTKKSSGGRRGGRSTRTASSNLNGEAAPLSASQGAPVSRRSSVNTSAE